MISILPLTTLTLAIFSDDDLSFGELFERAVLTGDGEILRDALSKEDWERLQAWILTRFFESKSLDKLFESTKVAVALLGISATWELKLDSRVIPQFLVKKKAFWSLSKQAISRRDLTGCLNDMSFIENQEVPIVIEEELAALLSGDPATNLVDFLSEDDDRILVSISPGPSSRVYLIDKKTLPLDAWREKARALVEKRLEILRR